MLPVPSLCKTPSEYDNRTSSANADLPEKYLTIAREELRESPLLKDQALDQLRDWIAKNPAIKSCRTDARFLLKFLRTRKYSHVAACKNLERYLVLRQSQPRWFGNLDTSEAWVGEAIEAYPVLPLGYNAEGRAVILCQFGNFDPKKFDRSYQLRLFAMVLESFQEEDETQIAGIEVVFNYRGFSLAHMAQWPLVDVKRYVDYMLHTVPVRVKGVHFINMPRFTVVFGEMLVGTFNAKLRSRTKIHKSMDDFASSSDVTVLPKELDPRGECTVEELKDRLRKRLATYRDVIYVQSSMEIDSAVCGLQRKQDEFGLKGSFRKLNLD